MVEPGQEAGGHNDVKALSFCKFLYPLEVKCVEKGIISAGELNTACVWHGNDRKCQIFFTSGNNVGIECSALRPAGRDRKRTYSSIG